MNNGYVITAFKIMISAPSKVQVIRTITAQGFDIVSGLRLSICSLSFAQFKTADADIFL